MFADTTKAVVKTLGPGGDLFPNKNIKKKIQMLSLVKVSKKIFKTEKYMIDMTLLDLLEEADFSPKYTEEVLISDFTNLKYIHAGACAETKVKAAGEVKVSAAMDTVDGASSFTLVRKKVDISELRESCNNKKINKKRIDELKLEKDDKLTFVCEVVYNTAPVTFVGFNHKAASFGAGVKLFLKSKVSGVKKEMTCFTVPEKKTLAYGLMDIETDNGTLHIPPKLEYLPDVHKPEIIEEFIRTKDGEVIVQADRDDYHQIRQQVDKEIQNRKDFLQSLADLPESTRSDLLNTITELIEERDTLTLLEETLDQDSTGVSDCPQSEAAHGFVGMMDSLPDDLPALLTSCSPDTLRVLNQLVDSLKEDGETKLPESLPPPLQEEGELRWVAELLCSSNQTLRELSDQWDRPELSLEELLENLCLVIWGLSLIKPETES